MTQATTDFSEYNMREFIALLRAQGSDICTEAADRIEEFWETSDE
jgi:hypothetical protein